jgi:predicted DNA-binding transcriptional regulator AlpA
MSNEKISLTEAEVEALTGLRVKTLQRWRYLNQGPRFVRLGRCVRYPAADLRGWIDSQVGGGERADTKSEIEQPQEETRSRLSHK